MGLSAMQQGIVIGHNRLENQSNSRCLLPELQVYTSGQ